MKALRKITSHTIVIPSIIILVLVAALGYGGYRYYNTDQSLKAVQGELASTTLQYGSTTAALSLAEQEIVALNDALTAEQAKNGEFAHQISDIASTVGTLQKLSKTDPELLKKYSKVYFLNENYIPSSLSPIPSEYISDARTLRIHGEVLSHLEDLMDEASSSGKALRIASAYRSFKEQAALKSMYKVQYGSGANTFSAEQGYSEHQLGTAVDFTSPKIGGLLAGFDKTSEYQWLLDNAYKYGFIISYPKENTYYQFEPWHWRYVGIQLATDLHDDGKYFYNWEQRELDSYLVHIFD